MNFVHLVLPFLLAITLLILESIASRKWDTAYRTFVELTSAISEQADGFDPTSPVNSTDVALLEAQLQDMDDDLQSMRDFSRINSVLQAVCSISYFRTWSEAAYLMRAPL